MPWQTNSELPTHIKSVLPLAAQTRFRMTANSALENGVEEKSAIARAWVSVKAGWKRPKEGGIWIRKSEDEIAKAKPRTLYVCRYVKNASDIIKWAKGEGFKTVLKPDDLHVTIAYSKKPVDWMKEGIAPSSYFGPDDKGELIIAPGGPRLVEPLGDKGAVVLLFASEPLAWRNKRIQDEGGSWDHDGYQPHITITWDAGDLDVATVQPYTGKIVLGPEIFKEINDNWSDNITEKLKADYAEAVRKFDPNQARDSDGRWSETGGGGDSDDAPKPKSRLRRVLRATLRTTGEIAFGAFAGAMSGAEKGPVQAVVGALVGGVSYPIFSAALRRALRRINEREQGAGDPLQRAREAATAKAATAEDIFEQISDLPTSKQKKFWEYFLEELDEKAATKLADELESKLEKFDPNQPRDAEGQWSSGGGSSGSNTGGKSRKEAVTLRWARGAMTAGIVTAALPAGAKLSAAAAMTAYAGLIGAAAVSGGAIGTPVAAAIILSVARQLAISGGIAAAEAVAWGVLRKITTKLIERRERELNKADDDEDEVLALLHAIRDALESYEPKKKEVEKVDVQVVKVDSSLGLVFGWAIICKNEGEDYYDLNIDKSTGERVPEHITEPAMLECAMDFMKDYRMAKEMHDGDEVGTVPFAFPLTTDIAKRMGIETKTTGLMIAMHPSKEVFAKFASGEYTGFSIGGSKVKIEETE